MRSKCAGQLGIQCVTLFGADNFFPVDHAINEIDRVIVGRQWHQNAAIHRVVTRRIDEFGFEADRRTIGDDLKIMVGQPRQQRPCRHIGNRQRLFVETAFMVQFDTEIRDCRIFGAACEIEQHAIGAEISQFFRVQVLDRRQGATVKQRHPVIVSAHVHASLIASDRSGRINGIIVFIRLIPVITRKITHPVHSASPESFLVNTVMVPPWLPSR